MEQNYIHIAPKSLFSQCDNRWINGVFSKNRVLWDYFNYFFEVI